MRTAFLAALLNLTLLSPSIADIVTLDTGSTMEGVLREEGDKVFLQYVSSSGGTHHIKTIEIPRHRIKRIDYDPGYFRKYGGMVSGLGGAGIPITISGNGKQGDSLSEAIKQGNLQVQKNLRQEKEHMKHSRFYYGWHEGFHWDPPNGWHRWNHEGLYDPYDSNIRAKQEL